MALTAKTLTPKVAPGSVAYKVRRQFQGENGFRPFRCCDCLPPQKRFFTWKVNFAAAVNAALQQEGVSRCFLIRRHLPLISVHPLSIRNRSPVAGRIDTPVHPGGANASEDARKWTEHKKGMRRKRGGGRRRILKGRICKNRRLFALHGRAAHSIRAKRTELSAGGLRHSFLLDKTIVALRAPEKSLHGNGCQN